MSSILRSLRQVSAASYTSHHVAVPLAARCFASSSRQSKSPFSRPGPPPLPAAEQAEFDELVKANQAIGTAPAKEADIIEHRDIRKGARPAFEGEVNPKTGEHGGPKTDPFLAGGGDWQYGGRVTVSILPAQGPLRSDANETGLLKCPRRRSLCYTDDRP